MPITKLVPSTLTVLILTAFSFQAHCETLDFRDSDKQLHLISSYALNTTILVSVPKNMENRRLVAAAATITVGLLKELTDSQFSGSDLAADALGVALSTAVSFTFDF